MMLRSLLLGALAPFVLAACMAGPPRGNATVAQGLDEKLTVTPWADHPRPLWPASMDGAVVIVTNGAKEELALAFLVLPERLEIEAVYEIRDDRQCELDELNRREWREAGVLGLTFNDEGHGVIVGPPPTGGGGPTGGDIVPPDIQRLVLDIASSLWDVTR